MARGPSPFYASGPGGNPPEAFGAPAPPTVTVTDDPKVVRATRMHRQGSLIYLVAWLAIGIAIVVLALDMALLFSDLPSLLSSSSSSSVNTNLLADLTLGSMGLLGGGFVMRGIGFSMMLHADFLLRSRVPPRLGFIQ